MKILFWNTHNNKKINTYIKDIVIENDINIVVLAEYNANVVELIQILQMENKNMHQYVTPGCKRLTILGTINDVEPGFQKENVSFQVIKQKNLLCCIHLPSKIYGNNERKREIAVSQIVEEICLKEESLKSDNTIVVGDFNMNPYELGCIDAEYFHGMPVYNVSTRKTRMIEGKTFKMFYNPMWNFFGDFEAPFGTYYYKGSTSDNIYWHIYDQVLIRPQLRDNFNTENLKIITNAGNIGLLNERGNLKSISDHLPIMFEIEV